jgi:hypothetical protein
VIEVRGHPVFWERRFPRMTEGRELPDRREKVRLDPNAYRI